MWWLREDCCDRNYDFKNKIADNQKLCLFSHHTHHNHTGAPKPAFNFKKAAVGAFAAASIASGVATTPAHAIDAQFNFGSTTIVTEKVNREGLYRDYEVDITQERDDARSTFKAAKETKSKKGKLPHNIYMLRSIHIIARGACRWATYLIATPLTPPSVRHHYSGKYTALLAVLVVGSFIIPMAQYFWYVRDDDSSDKFFAEDVPEPPKKKKWF